MYYHIIKEMAKKIHDDICKNGASESGITAVLEQYWTDHIAIIWTLEDVEQEAKELGVELSREEALQALESLSCHHDASIGVSWSTIDHCIGDVVASRIENIVGE